MVAMALSIGELLTDCCCVLRQEQLAIVVEGNARMTLKSFATRAQLSHSTCHTVAQFYVPNISGKLYASGSATAVIQLTGLVAGRPARD